MVDITEGGMQKGLDCAVTIKGISLDTCWSDTRLVNTLISSVFRSVCSLASM